MSRMQTSDELAVEGIGHRFAERGPGERSDEEIRAAYSRCREITRQRARNFYYGLRLTPEPKRSAIYAVYAWMRAADDAVDEPGTLEQRRARLEDFADWTWTVLAGIGPPVIDGHAERAGREWLVVALGDTVARYGIDHAIFDDMLGALRTDLEQPALGTEADLERYCYGVAGTAGLACVTIWGLRRGVSREAARELALRRGQAFQRTNILRDFAEDYDGAGGDGEDRRVYVPRETLENFGLTAEALRRWSPPDRCEALVRDMAARTRAFYAGSADLEGMIDPTCAPTLWAMTRIYSGLLDQVEADPQRIVLRGDERVRLAPAAKATIAIRAALGARIHRW